MADHGHKDGHNHEGSSSGKMDISQHTAMWHSFWNVSVYSVGGLLVLALLLAVFRTHNG